MMIKVTKKEKPIQKLILHLCVVSVGTAKDRVFLVSSFDKNSSLLLQKMYIFFYKLKKEKIFKITGSF